jgi:uncharacterized protein YlxW (UPF0749 family)
MSRQETGVGWPEETPDQTPGETPPHEDSPPPEVPHRRSAAAGAIIGVLLALLGFALVVQLKNSNRDANLAAARPDDLARILSDLDAQQDRLRQEIADLQDSQRQLTSGAQGREAALAEARRRADELGILAGTLPAEGPGLEIRLTPGTERIKAETLLDAVEELRGAGAEAMQVSGVDPTAVRIVASTAFVDEGAGITADHVRLTAPYTVLVIGGPQTMRTALNIPGGVVDTVRQHGGTVSVREVDLVRVGALHASTDLRFARPTS